jgi:hypothetical protein
MITNQLEELDVEKTTNISLIQTANQFVTSVQKMQEFIEKVPELTTPELTAGYSMLKAYEKGFTGLQSAMRDELIGTQDKDKVYQKDGRIFLEGDGKDAKGNPILETADGCALKAAKSSKVAFDAEMARDVLEKYGKVLEGSDKKITCDTDQVEDFIQFLLESIKPEHQPELTQRLTQVFDVELVPNQEKIKALITTGQLPTKAVDGMFETKDVYSLTVSSNPYAPAKPKKK